jgi:hypothetical protein
MLDSNLSSRAATARPVFLAAAFCALMLSLVVLPGCGGPAETVTDPTAPRPLVLQPEVDMMYRTRGVADQEITISVMGQEVNIFQEITSYIEFRVDRLLANGNFLAQVTHTRYQLEQEGPDSFEQYDTDDPDAEPQSETSFGMASLVGVPLKVRVMPTGDVTILDGMDAVYNNMTDVAGVTDAARRDTLRAVFAEELRPEDLSRDLLAGFYMYPTGTVAPGSTWTISTISDMLLPLSLQGTATMDSASVDTVYVSVEGQLESLPDTSGALPDSFESADLSGPFTGTVKMDRQMGFVLSIDLNQSLSGEAEMNAGGQTLPVTIAIETKGTVDGSILPPPAAQN